MATLHATGVPTDGLPPLVTYPSTAWSDPFGDQLHADPVHLGCQHAPVAPLGLSSKRPAPRPAKLAGKSDYLLPKEHAAWEILETLGLPPGCTSHPHTLVRFGFMKVTSDLAPSGPTSVWRHPHLDGYLIKITTKGGKKPSLTPLDNYLMRIENARELRAFLDEKEYTWITVPEKWLYQVGKHEYVMVVEEMHLVPGIENQRDCYRNIKEECLIQLINTLRNFQWGDDRIENLPFTLDGRVCFIDTECIKETLLFKRCILRYLRPGIKPLALQLLSK